MIEAQDVLIVCSSVDFMFILKCSLNWWQQDVQLQDRNVGDDSSVSVSACSSCWINCSFSWWQQDVQDRNVHGDSSVSSCSSCCMNCCLGWWWTGCPRQECWWWLFCECMHVHHAESIAHSVYDNRMSKTGMLMMALLWVYVHHAESIAHSVDDDRMSKTGMLMIARSSVVACSLCWMNSLSWWWQDFQDRNVDDGSSVSACSSCGISCSLSWWWHWQDVQDRNVDDGSCSVHTGGESFPSVWRSVWYSCSNTAFLWNPIAHVWNVVGNGWLRSIHALVQLDA